MLITNVKLYNQNDAINICKAACKFEDVNVDAEYKTYVVDAKSLVGLISISFAKNINLRVHVPDDINLDVLESIKEELGSFGEIINNETKD